MGAGEKIGGRSQDIKIEELRNVPGSPDFHGMQNRGVPDPVAIDFSNGGVLGMKFSRRRLAPNHPNFSRQVGVHGRHPGRRIHFASWHVDMRHLSQGVNSGIRASSPVQFHPRRQDLRESVLKMILNPVLVWLTLPAAKRPAVVCDGQFQAFERGVHCKESM